MSEYTLLKEPKADAIINKDLQIIVNTLVNKLGKYIRSIYLTGGFGRGEGTVIQREGNYYPVNDYDIEVVCKICQKKKISREIVKITSEIDTLVHVKQVDINVVSSLRLMIPFNTVKRYEIKNGNKLLFGKKISINSFSADKIPLIEGTNYYTNRMGGLLFAYLLLLNEKGIEIEVLAELIQIELDKAVFAIGDALLIQNSMYSYSYLKRKELIKSLESNEADLNRIIKLYSKSIDYRYNPNREIKTLKELKGQWFDIVNLFISSFLKYESSYHKLNISDTKEYVTYIKLKGQSINFKIKGIFYPQFTTNLINIRCEFLITLTHIISNDNYLLPTFEKNEFKIVNRVKKILKDWHPFGIMKEFVG